MSGVIAGVALDHPGFAEAQYHARNRAWDKFYDRNDVVGYATTYELNGIWYIKISTERPVEKGGEP